MHVVRIAASDAQLSEKRMADFVCPVTDVSAIFTAAFALLPADGGVIELSTGTFLFNSNLALPNKACTIEGQTYVGPDKDDLPTMLQFTLGGVDDCVTFWASRIPQTLKNVGIKGDDVNTRYGVYIPGSSAFNQLEHVVIFDVTGEAFLTDTASSQCVFTRCASRNNDEGFKIFGVTHKFYACSATRDAVTGIGGTHGFRIQGIGCVLNGCVAERHGIGFHASGFSEGASFFGCYTEQCSIAYQADGAPDPINPLFSGCTGVSSQHAVTGAILLDAVIHPVVIGCQIKQSVSGLSLQLGANCLRAVVKDCALQDMTQLNAIGGATYRIEDCIDENDAWFDASA